MPFARILRSSALMGGAQVVMLAAGFIRTKIVALVLGAQGIGLVGVLNAYSGNIASLAGWGLSTSGVRLIAGASEADRPGKIAAVRRLGRLLSCVGLTMAVILFWPIGRLTFGSGRYDLEMATAGLAVPCLIASGAWASLLQASGQIKSLAKVQAAGALAGFVLGAPFILWLGSEGVALSVLLAAAVPALVLWRSANLHHSPSSQAEAGDIRFLLRMGGALMVVSWLAQLSAFAIRLIIVRRSGLEAAGHYQAAYSIAGSLPGFVFAAMGTDFFPRVAAVADEAEAAEAVDRQVQAGLLLALPFLVALLTMGKLCIRLLFAEGFDPAIMLLPWMIWGVFFRLIAWPHGYWLLARGSATAVVMIELAGNVVATIIPLILYPSFGLEGAAIGFFLGYVFYVLMMLSASRLRSGRWPGIGVFCWFASAAAVLGLAQFSVSKAGGLFWGLLPSGLVALACFLIYRKALRVR